MKKFIGAIIKICFVIIVLLAGVIVGFFVMGKTNPMEKFFVTRYSSSQISSTVVKDVLPAAEYVTLTYRYNALENFSDEAQREVLGRTIPYFKKVRQLLFSFSGTIKLGINGKNIQVKQSGNIIQLIMPQIEIISNDFDPNTLKFHVEDTKGIFVKDLTTNEKNQFAEKKKIAMGKEVLEDKNIIADAKTSAEELFGVFLKQLPSINEYTIEFIWEDDPNGLIIKKVEEGKNDY